VESGAVVPGDVFHDGVAGSGPSGPRRGVGEFAFGEAKKLSASALSQHWMARP
jgi:hypothetical protein